MDKNIQTIACKHSGIHLALLSQFTFEETENEKDELTCLCLYYKATEEVTTLPQIYYS